MTATKKTTTTTTPEPTPLRAVPRPTRPCAYNAGEIQIGDRDGRERLMAERRRAANSQTTRWAVRPGAWVETPIGVLRGPAPVSELQVPRWRLNELRQRGLVSCVDHLRDEADDHDPGPEAA